MWSVGIDLGSESVKIVCLAKEHKEWALVSYGLFSKNQTELIKATLEHPNLKRASIRVSMKDSIFKIRKLELPPAPEDDLGSMVSIALSQQLPEPVENYVLRYQPLQKLVYISEKKQINEYLQELEVFGISQPAVLEPRLNALSNTALYNHPLKEQVCYALVDIGRSAALFSVIAPEGLIFGRNLSESCGADLLSQIAEHLQVSLEAIEERKRNESNFLTLQNPDSKGAIIQWLYKVAIEIQNSVENYQLQFPEQKIAGLLLTGGASQMRGLASYVQDTLKIPVEPLRCFRQINTSGFSGVDFESVDHYYATAVGLAL